MRRLKALETCRSRASQKIVSTLEGLKAKLHEIRHEVSRVSCEDESCEPKTISATVLMSAAADASRTAWNDISNQLKNYHAHISKLNRYIDQLMLAHASDDCITQILPSHDCRLTPPVIHELLSTGSQSFASTSSFSSISAQRVDNEIRDYSSSGSPVRSISSSPDPQGPIRGTATLIGEAAIAPEEEDPMLGIVTLNNDLKDLPTNFQNIELSKILYLRLNHFEM